MSHVLVCEIGADALPHLMALRLSHLEYIAAHRDDILFGGPARRPDGTPETMIIMLKTDDIEAAAAFIAAEPYNASSKVFASVTIRAWSQVIPEQSPGALATTIATSRSMTS
jgi:uncharacterized protein